MTMKRRQFLNHLGAVSCSLGVAGASQVARGQRSVGPPMIGTNTYPWLTFARREGNELTLHTDELLGKIRTTGIVGYEPIINQPGEVEGLQERLQKHSLSMPSIYVNSVLHDPRQVEDSVGSVIEIAKAVKPLGTKIIVTNPSPIRWGGDEDKDDAQLRLQAKSLDQLGVQLRGMGMQLAYHNHDAELRAGGREFHHMLSATDPQNVKFCLDAHWVFRGCGDSEVAVFDVVRLYHDRIIELHLRQSAGGVWTESFSAQGDIDYVRLFSELDQRGIEPLMVLEQAVEEASTVKLSATAAHRISRDQLAAALWVR